MHSRSPGRILCPSGLESHSNLCRIWKRSGKRTFARIEARSTSPGTIVGILPSFSSKLAVLADSAPSLHGHGEVSMYQDDSAPLPNFSGGPSGSSLVQHLLLVDESRPSHERNEASKHGKAPPHRSDHCVLACVGTCMHARARCTQEHVGRHRCTRAMWVDVRKYSPSKIQFSQVIFLSRLHFSFFFTSEKSCSFRCRRVTASPITAFFFERGLN